MNKPKFDPSKPYEEVKPAFDPNAAYETVNETPREDPEAIATRLAEQDYDVKKPGMIESAGLSALQGATREWGDNIAAGMNTAMNGDSFENNLDSVRNKMQRAKLENPKISGASNFITSVATAPIAMTPGGAAGIAAAEGFARRMGEASKLNPDAFLSSAAVAPLDAAGGALVQRYAPALLDKAGQYAKPLVDKLRDFAGRNAVRSLGRATPTQAKAMERKGITEDVGKWALDNKVVTAFANSKEMLKRTQQKLGGYRQEMKPIYEASKDQNISSEQLKQAILDKAKEVGSRAGKVKVAEKMASYADDVEKAARNSAVGNKGPVQSLYNPGAIGSFRKDIDGLIDWNSDKVSKQAERQIRALLRSKEMGLIRAKDPALETANEALFKNTHLGETAKDIARRGVQQNQTNNKMGLTSYLMGSGALGGSGALYAAGMDPKLIAAGGAAVMLGREATRRYGDQWLATGANKIAKVLSSETYKPLFDAAAKRGGTAVAALHDQLMNSDPSYAGLFPDEKKKLAGSTTSSKLQAAGLSATNNLLFGADDEVSGAMGALQGRGYEKTRDRYRRAKSDAMRRDPWVYQGTDIGMNSFTPAIGGSSSLKGATEIERLLRRAGAGALISGLSGAGQSESMNDVPKDVLRSALLGSVMGAGASAMAQGKMGVRDAGVGRDVKSRISLPEVAPSLKRMIDKDGEKLEHRVYVAEDGKASHYLIKGNKPVAWILGQTQRGKDNSAQLAVDWSQAEGGKGYGKTLYDLVLDTHKNIVSDEQLSKGSQGVYEGHLAKQPGVKADLASWGNNKSHKVSITDENAYNKKTKFPPFAPGQTPVLKKLDEVLGGKGEGYRKNVPEAKLLKRQEMMKNGLEAPTEGRHDRYLQSPAAKPVLDYVKSQVDSGVERVDVFESLVKAGYPEDLAAEILKSLL